MISQCELLQSFIFPVHFPSGQTISPVLHPLYLTHSDSVVTHFPVPTHFIGYSFWQPFAKLNFELNSSHSSSSLTQAPLDMHLY